MDVLRRLAQGPARHLPLHAREGNRAEERLLLQLLGERPRARAAAVYAIAERNDAGPRKQLLVNKEGFEKRMEAPKTRDEERKKKADERAGRKSAADPENRRPREQRGLLRDVRRPGHSRLDPQSASQPRTEPLLSASQSSSMGLGHNPLRPDPEFEVFVDGSKAQPTPDEVLGVYNGPFPSREMENFPPIEPMAGSRVHLDREKMAAIQSERGPETDFKVYEDPPAERPRAPGIPPASDDVEGNSPILRTKVAEDDVNDWLQNPMEEDKKTCTMTMMGADRSRVANSGSFEVYRDPAPGNSHRSFEVYQDPSSLEKNGAGFEVYQDPPAGEKEHGFEVYRDSPVQEPAADNDGSFEVYQDPPALVCGESFEVYQDPQGTAQGVSKNEYDDENDLGGQAAISDFLSKMKLSKANGAENSFSTKQQKQKQPLRQLSSTDGLVRKLLPRRQYRAGLHRKRSLSLS